jgi:hypothetical protein
MPCKSVARKVQRERDTATLPTPAVAPCLPIERLLDEVGLADDLRMRGRAHAAGLSWAASARALGNVVRRLL